jgi:ATP-binding cassette subfamily B protein
VQSGERAPKPADAFRELSAPIRGALTLAATLQAFATIAGLVPFAAGFELAREVLPPGGPAPDHDRLWTITFVAIGAAVVHFVLAGLAIAVSHRADADLQLLLRRRIAEHLSRVPLGWFTETNSGTVQQALQNDIDDMHYVVAHARLDLTAAIAAPLASLSWLFSVNWALALITLAPIAGFAMAQKALLGGAREQMGAVAGAMAKVNTAVVEFVQGSAALKTFGQGAGAHRRFDDAADEYHRVFTAGNAPILRTVSLSTGFVSPVAMLLVILAGGTLLVEAGQTTPVDVLPFVLLGLGLTAPVQTAGGAAAALHSASAAAGRVRDLLAVPTLPEPAAPETTAPETTAPDLAYSAERGLTVEFRGVDFAYRPESPVLRGINLRLAPGTVTALVGPSGAGKSTLAALLPRFHDPSAGEIRIGGRDLRDIPSDELYRLIGFVFQDIALPRATIADNIRLGRPHATLTQMVRAARAAAIHDRILDLPRGYDSVIGIDANLSGGERQRIAIARALLADAPILVLDEATAFADPDSEAAIQRGLSRLATGRTVLVIAHRLASVADADLIVVLDQGSVVERGRHDQLLAAGGLYSRLWQVAGAQKAEEAV